MTSAAWVRIGVSLAAATAAGFLGIGLAVASTLPSGIEFLGIGASVTMVVNAALFSLVGAIVALRKAGHLVGWLFVVAGLAWAAYVVGSTYAEYSLAYPTRRLPAQDFVIWTSAWTPLVAIGCVPALLIFVFPTGRLSSPRWRWVARLAVLAATAGIVGSAFASGPYQDFPAISNPFALKGVGGRVMFFLKEAAWPILIFVFLFGARNLRERARSGGSTERLQIKWMVLSAVGMAAFALFWGVSYFLGSQDLAQSVSGLAVSILPISVGIAMMRHRLYDIDLILNRTLVYAVLTGILALVYLGAVVLFQQVLSPITAESDLAVAASTLAVAALFTPLRSRVQSFIDRRYYRRRYDASATLAEFSARLRNEVDLEALGRELVAVAGSTMQPAHASIWLRAGDGGR